MGTIDLQIKSVLAEKDKMKFPYVSLLFSPFFRSPLLIFEIVDSHSAFGDLERPNHTFGTHSVSV